MSHVQQRIFCNSVKDRFSDFFKFKRVLDCGSLDINGNNRYLFSDCEYIGIDIGDGPNVDVVSKIHEFRDPIGFDTIVSTECFEHNMYYTKSLQNVCQLLKSGGLFLFTCATTGRAVHGTKLIIPNDSPFTSEIEYWQEYYMNVTEEDVRAVINIDDIFEEYEFKINETTYDLYFWGIKK